MAQNNHSSVAQLLFSETPLYNFAHLVAELEGAIRGGPFGPGTVTWDCDDLVFVDTVGCRFTLSHAAWPDVPCAASLTLSVGPAPNVAAHGMAIEGTATCRLLVQRLDARYGADALLWHLLDGAMTAAMIDELVDATPALMAEPEPPEPAVQRLEPACPPAANDVPDVPLTDHAIIGRVRAALYPPADTEAAPSPQLRLAAHAMDATLIAVALPVGIAMLTYSLLKGGRAQVSARVMAVTCTAVTLAQTPLAAQVSHWL